MSLNDEITKKFGVDVDALAAECLALAGSGILEEHEKDLDALFATIVICIKQNMLTELHGTTRTVFLLGYKAGLDAPDLSVFSDALKENNDE